MTENNNENPTEDKAPQDTPADAQAAAQTGATPEVNLEDHDAVKEAAEKWKGASHRNIQGLEDLPIDNDTANLREGPSLNDALLALLPLVGVWRGAGQASTDEGEFAFGQQVTFAHDGGEYLTYESRLWKLDEEGNPQGTIERESGFWRISPKDEIEVTVTNSLGVVEILYGQPLQERAWELESGSTLVTEKGPVNLGPGKRLYGLMPNHNLGWVEERLVEGEMRPRLSAELERVVG